MDLPQQLSKGRSSFSSTEAPCFRRNSFLSRSMIDHEKASVYESFSFFHDTPQQSIISLKECQGFIFNQNLFATPYQQLRSAAKEKRLRALSFSKVKSRTTSETEVEKQKARRHTSHELKPHFQWGSIGSDVAVEDDLMEVDSGDQATKEDELKHNEEDELKHSEEDEEDLEDDNIDELDEYEEAEYGLFAVVEVTDILIDEKDQDYLPSKDWNWLHPIQLNKG